MDGKHYELIVCLLSALYLHVTLFLRAFIIFSEIKLFEFNGEMVSVVIPPGLYMVGYAFFDIEVISSCRVQFLVIQFF